MQNWRRRVNPKKKKAITLIIIEDHSAFRKALATYLNDLDDFVVLGDFEKATDALKFIGGKHIDVAIVDYTLPEMDGITFILRANE
jgi:DNA-binding NarL/FixJ family response regulator